MDSHIESELEMDDECVSFKEKVVSREDHNTELILYYYNLLTSDSMKMVRIVLAIIPFALIFSFSLFVSNSYSNIIAFSSLVISIIFMGVSFWMLGWILAKDSGSQAMKDIGDPIKEGSEGFFITQYGTIFKLAFATSILLVFMYLYRSPASGNSEVHLYVSS